MLKRWQTRILLFLAVLGPGFITANVDNDAGGILTYSGAGAQFGYSLLWTILPITVALIVVQEMCARMGVVTGKGLSDLIREEFGLRATFVTMVLLLIVNFGLVMTEFIGIAGSLELFHISKYISVPVCARAGVAAGGARRLQERGEGLSRGQCLLHRLHHHRRALRSKLARGDAGHGQGADGERVAYAGIYLDDDRGDRHHDCAVDAVLSAVVGGGEGRCGEGLCGVAAGRDCGVDLHRRGGVVHRGGVRGDAVCARRGAAECAGGCGGGDEAAGQGVRLSAVCDWAVQRVVLCGFGAAALDCLHGMRGAGIRVRRGQEAFDEAPVFYWLYTLLIAGGAGVVLLPHIQPMKVVVETQVLSGVLLPVILVMMLLLINRKDLMGSFVNPRWMNVVAWTTAAVVVVLSVGYVYSADLSIARLRRPVGMSD